MWGAAAVAFVAALSTEGWLLLRFRRAAQTAAATLAARQREWRTLAALRPPPTPAGAAAVEAECARAAAQRIFRGDLFAHRLPLVGKRGSDAAGFGRGRRRHRMETLFYPDPS